MTPYVRFASNPKLFDAVGEKVILEPLGGNEPEFQFEVVVKALLVVPVQTYGFTVTNPETLEFTLHPLEFPILQ